MGELDLLLPSTGGFDPDPFAQDALSSGAFDSSRAADVGGTWTVGSGTWSTSGGKLGAQSTDSDTTDIAFLFPPLGAYDVRIEATLTTPAFVAASDALRSGFVFRCAGTSDFCFLRTLMDPSQLGADEFEVGRFQNGSGSVCAFTGLGDFWQPSTSYAIRADVRGQTVTVSVDGVLKASLPIDLPVFGTGVGVYWNRKDDGSRWSNFSVKPLYDDSYLTPEECPELLAWWRANDVGRPSFGIADGAAVTNWTDFTSHAFVETQATAGSKPVCKHNIAGGRSAIRFDGSNDGMACAAIGAAFDDVNALTIMAVVANYGAPSAARTLVELALDAVDQVNAGIQIGADNKPFAYKDFAGIAQQATVTAGSALGATPRILTATFDLGRSTNEVNLWDGLTKQTTRANNGTTAGVNWPNHALHVGCRDPAGTPSRAAPIDVLELAVWRRELTPAEIAGVVASRADMYGITP